MPWYPAHILTGAVATWAIILATDTPLLESWHRELGIAVLATTVVFSVLPDIDHKASRVSALLHFSAICALARLALFQSTLNLSSFVLIVTIVLLELYHRAYAKSGVHHRQFPHSYTFLILMTIALFLISASWLITLIWFICCFLHLALDNYLMKAWRKDRRMWKKVFSLKFY